MFFWQIAVEIAAVQWYQRLLEAQFLVIERE